MRVRVLPDQIANQIAAGEVVDRPASVVRELVDNAVDAGATEIVVRLERGGQSAIIVSDDGEGMERDDALLAFQRHATSKIGSAEDLFGIRTLGFRGEALPSIAAVSKVQLISRTAASVVGTQVIVEGGELRHVREASRSNGTEVQVRRLFYNTPARRKFLKSPRTEELRIRQWLLQSSLSHPEIRYRLYADDHEILNLPRRPSLRERAQGMIKGSTVSFGFEDSTPQAIAVRGIVAHPAMAQMDSAALVVLVNGRLVSDKLILRAVREGFDSTLKEREYPVGVIAIGCAPEEVDVNVHPQKSEVRFREPQTLFTVVRAAVLEAVRSFRAPVTFQEARAAVPQYISSRGAASQSGAQQSSLELTRTPTHSISLMQNENAPSLSVAPAPQVPLAEVPTSEFAFPFSKLHYIGQALACYLFCEYEGALYVVDMHAAHERLNYNLVRNRFRSGALSSQTLLVPITVELTEEALERCLTQSATLERLGFSIESFGPTTLLVRAVPGMLVHRNVTHLMQEIGETSFADEACGRVEEALDHIAARIACHASVRSGEGLTKAEAEALFAAMDSSEFSAACPHGRPVIVRFAADAVERWFGRDR